jgi:hypothetical protein
LMTPHWLVFYVWKKQIETFTAATLSCSQASTFKDGVHVKKGPNAPMYNQTKRLLFQLSQSFVHDPGFGVNRAADTQYG